MRRSVLLLCDDDRRHPGAIRDHIAALRRHSRHRVHVYNPRGVDAAGRLDLDEFDVVVVHYSLAVDQDEYLAPSFRERLARFRGLKVQFIQDEYRRVPSITAAIREIGTHVLFSVVPPAEAEKLYGERLPGVRVLTTLTGYVPDELVAVPTPPHAERPLDIGYRGRANPYWLGRVAQEKVWIAEGVAARAAELGLAVDLSSAETDRIYGAAWPAFVASARATLGTPSGASIADLDGTVEASARAYLREHPTATFDETFAAVLAPYEGNVVIDVISPRMFEAAALRTAMVLFPGSYSGILEPWRHYLPLERDFSNLPELAERLRDLPFLRELTERAHADLIASGRFSARVLGEQLDAVVDEHDAAPARGPGRAFRLARVERTARAGAVAGVRPRDLARHAAWTAIGLRLVACSPPLRRLLREYVRTPAAHVGPRRLAPDLLRLALLAAGHAGASRILAPFAVRAAFADGRLTLLGMPRGSGPVRAAPAAQADVLAALRSGELREIVWDHSLVGSGVYFRVGRRRLGLAVGYHRTPGVYHLGAFAHVARALPDAAAAVLAPLLEPPASLGRRERVLPRSLPSTNQEVE